MTNPYYEITDSITYKGYSIQNVVFHYCRNRDRASEWWVMFNGNLIQGFEHKVEAKANVDWRVERKRGLQ